MNRNIGTTDKAIRIVLALVAAWLYYTGRVSGTLAIVVLVIAIMLVVTSLISWCPAYMPFKFSSRKTPSA